MANIFRTAYNRLFHGRTSSGVYFDPDELGIAIPDMSYTPREIIQRFTMGTLPNIGMSELIQDMDEVSLARLLDDDDVMEVENDRLLMNQQIGEKYSELISFINSSNETLRKNLAPKQASELQEGTSPASGKSENAS